MKTVNNGTPPASSSCPYETLYIYEMRGSFTAPDDLFKTGFLGSWEEGEEYSFLFFTVHNRDEVKKAAADHGLEYRSETVMPYSQWEAGDKIRPLTAGRFFICPAWLEKPEPENTVPVILDPGVAFGSGYHSTTRDCLELMSQGFGHQEFPARVLDLGSGTGILAISAARAGAREVLAVEMNNLSARTAARNAVLNGLEDTVTIIQARAEDHVSGSWDLVLANLTYPVLSELLNTPAFRKSPSLILSGLRPPELESMMPELLRSGLKLMARREHDDWSTVLLKR
ncbi:50S ribosomal protein L11 methyltransferase [Fibrobacterota bacterium]